MANPKINITVVVSGAPQGLPDVNTHNKVEHLMREALKEAGIHDPDLAEWTLRSEEGGPAIDPGARIADTGIAEGAILYLDPDEGGGGQVAVVSASADEPPPAPVLVDPAVSRAKLERQFDDWHSNRDAYRRRGWLLLDSDLEQLQVDVAFACYLPVGGFNDIVATPLAARFDFHNYDVWAPSVRLVDPLTGRWLALARLDALDFKHRDGAGNPQQTFIGGHPETKRVFLCKRGVREYHSHFEHSGDDWLLYRGGGLGTLAQLCEVIWRLTTRTVTGLNFVTQRIPVGDAAAVNAAVEIRQEDVEQLSAQAQAQLQSQPKPMPAEVQAQLAVASQQGQNPG